MCLVCPLSSLGKWPTALGANDSNLCYCSKTPFAFCFLTWLESIDLFLLENIWLPGQNPLGKLSSLVQCLEMHPVLATSVILVSDCRLSLECTRSMLLCWSSKTMEMFVFWHSITYPCCCRMLKEASSTSHGPAPWLQLSDHSWETCHVSWTLQDAKNF